MVASVHNHKQVTCSRKTVLVAGRERVLNHLLFHVISPFRRFMKVSFEIFIQTADSLLHDVAGQHFDAVALPGGMPGAKNLSESHELIVSL